MQPALKPSPFLSFLDIEQAHNRLKNHLPCTSFRYNYRLSRQLGCEIYIKFENEHVSGAFKERGALNKLLLLTDSEKKAGVIAASAGNHAQGVAYHAGRLGIPAVIVMPLATPMTKVEATKSFGAEVILTGDNFDECSQTMYQIQKERGLTLIHPFNDLSVMAGQGTIGLEIHDQAPADLDTMIVPIGGGGMIAGMSVALKHLRPEMEIYGVQTALYPAFRQAFHRQPVPANSISQQSLAEGIAVKNPGDICLLTAQPLLKDVLLVDEHEIEQAIALLVTEAKTVPEGAGAAGLAAIIAHPERFKDKKVGLVVCGGNIDSRLLSAVLTRSLFHQGRLFIIKMSVYDRPGFLAQVSDLIATQGGNIIEVSHNRYNLGMLAKDTLLSLTIEARDKHHAESIRQALLDAGYPLQNN